MTRLGTDGLTALSVAIADAIADRAQRVHDILAAAENALESFLGVLVGRQVHLLGAKRPKLRQINIVGIGDTFFIQDVLTGLLKVSAGNRDRAIRITVAALQAFSQRSRMPASSNRCTNALISSSAGVAPGAPTC